MEMRIINRGRGTGKTLALICASDVTGYPIVVWSHNDKDRVLKQAKDLGFNVEVYTVDEIRERTKYNHDRRELLVDEASKMLEEALTYYLGAPVKAITLTEKCFEISKDPEEGAKNE